MEDKTRYHPPIVSREEWLAERIELLIKEKEHTREYDRINAARRRLPMVEVEKAYAFDTEQGKKTLLELFGDKSQLIVYHFMFGPDWETGCPGCTSLVDEQANMDHLAKCDTAYTLVSRAPLEKLLAYKKERGWTHAWVSSGGSDFNFDFHVSFREGDPNQEYNYVRRNDEKGGEAPGMSVFFRVGDRVFHTNSVFARGLERLTSTYALLDLTPYGRQEDFEDSPEGWPQRPTYG